MCQIQKCFSFFISLFSSSFTSYGHSESRWKTGLFSSLPSLKNMSKSIRSLSLSFHLYFMSFSHWRKLTFLFSFLVIIYLLFSWFCFYGFIKSSIFLSLHPISPLSSTWQTNDGNGNDSSPSHYATEISSFQSSLYDDHCTMSEKFGFFPRRLDDHSDWFQNEKMVSFHQNSMGEIQIIINRRNKHNHQALPSIYSSCCVRGGKTIFPSFIFSHSIQSFSLFPSFQLMSSVGICRETIKQQFQLDELCTEKGRKYRQIIWKAISGTVNTNHHESDNGKLMPHAATQIEFDTIENETKARKTSTLRSLSKVSPSFSFHHSIEQSKDWRSNDEVLKVLQSVYWPSSSLSSSSSSSSPESPPSSSSSSLSSSSSCAFASRFTFRNGEFPISPVSHPSLYFDSSVCLKLAREFNYHLSSNHNYCNIRNSHVDKTYKQPSERNNVGNANITESNDYSDLSSSTPPLILSHPSTTAALASELDLFELDLHSGHRIPIHIYWNSESFHPQVILLIHSFIITQNLHYTQLIIWVPMDSHQDYETNLSTERAKSLKQIIRKERRESLMKLDPMLQYYLQSEYYKSEINGKEDDNESHHDFFSSPLMSHCVGRLWECFSVDIKPFEFSSLISFSPLSQSPHSQRYQWSSIHDDLAYLECDLFRLLVLYRYGGIYIDVDSLLLKDLEPLLSPSVEYLYPWQANCNEFNGAVMKFNEKSKAVEILLKEMDGMSMTPSKESNDFGSELYGRVWKKSQCGMYGTDQENSMPSTCHPSSFFSPLWSVLPPCFVNPSWISSGDSNVFHSGMHFPSQFDGPFVFHLHGEVWEYTKMMNSKEYQEKWPSDFDIMAAIIEWKFKVKTTAENLMSMIVVEKSEVFQ